MILSFVNIRKVPRKMLKTSGFALGFQHFPRDLSNVNEWKIMFDPYIVNLKAWYWGYKLNIQTCDGNVILAHAN